MTRRCDLSIPDSAGRCGVVATTGAPCAVMESSSYRYSDPNHAAKRPQYFIRGRLKETVEVPESERTDKTPSYRPSGRVGRGFRACQRRRVCPRPASLLWVRVASSSSLGGWLACECCTRARNLSAVRAGLK